MYVLSTICLVMYVLEGWGMSLDAAILGFLSEHPRSGYDLKTRCFDDAAKDFWTADQAQIYRTLERLQATRLVSAIRKRQAGKPDRKVYELTALGRAALDAWLGSRLPLQPPRDQFLLQLYFAADLSDTQLLELLADRRSLHQARLDDLRSRAVMSAGDSSASMRKIALRDGAFDGAIAMERAAIDWLDDSIEGLKAGVLPPAADTDSSQRHLFGPTTA
jgi:PadR family transcriptional regulator, regulatory protein AphA